MVLPSRKRTKNTNTKKNYKQYSPERLKRAINAVKNGNSSYKAAKEFNIHTSVIRRNLRNGNTNFPTRVLNNEEEQSLVTYIEYCYQRNFPLTRKMIKMFVRQIMKKMGREIPNQKGPSNKWFRSFLKRHKDQSMKKPQIIDGGRQRMANLTVMKQHFDLLEETLKRLCIFDKGQFIFNMDETGFGKSTVIDKVCTPKSSHSYTKMVTTSQHTTADGNVLPTMVIYEKSFPSGAYRRGIPEAWLFARSPNGYVDSELFIQWFKEIFLNSTSHLSQHNILLTMDNHESHLSIELIDLAIARNVDLFCLPPHTTHILQPLDVGCFKPLKKEFNDLSLMLGYASTDLIIGKNRFAQVLSTAVDKALSPYIVKNAFRKCGILPFNREAIDRKKLAPLDKSYKGSTSDHIDADQLCHSCGQFVYGHPLVKEGLIPQDLADIFVPIIGKAKKQLNTRVVTVARVITGLEWRKQLEDKEEKKTQKTKRQPRQNSKTSVNKQKSKKKSKKPVEKLTPEVEISECGDDLPELSRPKPKQKRKRKTVDGGMEMSTISDLKDCEDDECYTCGVCGVRGCVQDDNNGILWVWCDNDRCMKWFHRECIPSDQLPYVDLSLIVDSDWHCFLCSNNNNNNDINTFICQVCMLTEENVSMPDDEMFWMHCSVCMHMFHQSCVPSNIFTNYQRCLAISRQWVCGRCPEN